MFMLEGQIHDAVAEACRLWVVPRRGSGKDGEELPGMESQTLNFSPAVINSNNVSFRPDMLPLLNEIKMSSDIRTE